MLEQEEGGLRGRDGDEKLIHADCPRLGLSGVRYIVMPSSLSSICLDAKISSGWFLGVPKGDG